MKGDNGFIYFLLDRTSGWIKIGFSIDVKQRFRTHLCSNPNIAILYIMDNCNIQSEKSLHKYFSQQRIPNTTEWYKPKLILDYIERDKITKEYLLEII